MVDRTARDRLAEFVRHVATGRIGSDHFEAAAIPLVENSRDDGVGAVCGAVYALHGAVSELWPVRFRGRFRLAPDKRRRLAVAALFLYSDVEYEWPHEPVRAACLDTLLAFACGALVCVGLMLAVISLLLPIWFSIASCSFTVAVSIYRFSQRLAKRSHDEWEQRQRQFGDYEVWPFLRRADFDRSRQHSRLLSGNASK